VTVRILQVCNVGRIVGGTAACAWTITRALPECEHHVAFLSAPTADTKLAFQGASLHVWPRVEESRIRPIAPDVVILHNTSASRCNPIESAVTLQYVHSRGQRASTDRTVFCSGWLANECGAAAAASDSGSGQCLLQGVPRPVSHDFAERRKLADSLIVGRLCTPTRAKWPESLIDFYAELARRHSRIEWEFVGCPASLTPRLAEACRGRARFHEASWHARRHLCRWHAMLYHHPTLAESFGRTVAESLRAGCVPIVDDRGGFREQIVSGTGRLCGSIEDFDAALEEISDRQVLRKMSRRTKEHGDGTFSIAAFRERLWRVLTSMATG
jgi:hypothetical protein